MMDLSWAVSLKEGLVGGGHPVKGTIAASVWIYKQLAWKHSNQETDAALTHAATTALQNTHTYTRTHTHTHLK